MNGITKIKQLDGKVEQEIIDIQKKFKNFELGRWVAGQRRRKVHKTKEEILSLEKFHDWSWDPLWEKWYESFLKLQRFSSDNGHCNIPYKFKGSDKYPSGSWVSSQRKKTGIIN